MTTKKQLIPLFFLSLMIIWTSPVVRAAEFGIFDEYSIYTADKDGFKAKILLLFHGLKSAHPNGTFRRMEKAFSKDYSVVGFNYDYFDIDGNKRELNELWEKYMKGHEVTVLGTSLGGFWADYFANEYDIPKMVLVNPVIKPLTDLKQFIGPQYSERRQKHFDVTAEDVARYGQVHIKSSPVTQSMVFLSEDDPVIDYSNALHKFQKNKRSEVFVFKKGGHSVPLSDPRYLTVLRLFLETDYSQ